MTAQVISFSERVNARRVAAKEAQKLESKEKANKERVQQAAGEALILSDMMDLSQEDTLRIAAKLIQSETEKIQEEAQASSEFMPAYCSPDNEYRGSKYEATASLSLKEVAKRIRQDIKGMLKAGTLPKGTKVSVRMDGYNALRINITALPESFKVYKESYVRASKNFTTPADRYTDYYDGCYTPEFEKLCEALDSNTNSYNRDNSDIMTDYFDVRFYDGRASLGWELSKAVNERESVDLGENE